MLGALTHGQKTTTTRAHKTNHATSAHLVANLDDPSATAAAALARRAGERGAMLMVALGASGAACSRHGAPTRALLQRERAHGSRIVDGHHLQPWIGAARLMTRRLMTRRMRERLMTRG